MGMLIARSFNGRKLLSALKLLSASFLLLLSTIIVFQYNMFAQGGGRGTISGTVTDREAKTPLAGATVEIPNLRVGAITDKSGKFSFDAPAGTHNLEVRFIGYEKVTQRVTVSAGQTTNLALTMTTHAVQTNEVVVVGLTGEVDRNKLGSTIGSVSGRDVSRVVSSNAIDALSGRVTGVTVERNSGTAGAGTYITMRGRKTILGSSEPLYVVDGVIMDNTFVYDPNGSKQYSNRAVDINPEDIESIDILKGASASAMYGSLAGNGVVLITTKKGRLSSGEKPSSITFSSAIQTDMRVRDFPLQTSYGQIPGSNLSYGLPLPAGTQTYNQSSVPFRTGLASENTISLIGGVPQFDYLLSVTHWGETGYVIGSALDKNSIRANIGASILPGLNIQANTNYLIINNDLPQDGSNPSGILLGALRTPPEFNNEDYLNPDGTQHKFAAYDNPVWSEHNNIFNSKIERFIHSTTAKWRPWDWILVTGVIGFDRYTYTNDERLAVGSANSDNALGSINHQSILNKNTNLDFSINLNYNFAEFWQSNLVLGDQLIWFNQTTDNVNSTNTVPFYNQIDAGANKNGSSSTLASKFIGYFAQYTGTFFNRYTFTLGGRLDGSSTFGGTNTTFIENIFGGGSGAYHFYPKASISYLFSDEPFFEPYRKTVNNIRIRAAWGMAGSPSLPGPYATNFLYGSGGFFDPWGRVTTANRGGFVGLRQGGGSADVLIQAGATNINPEITTETEVGIDLGFWTNRLTLEATFYHDNVKDLILSVPVPSSTGYDVVLKNAGTMWNEGYELGLTGIPVMSDNFTWSSTLNYSRNYNLVTSLNIKDPSLATGQEYINLNGGFTGITNIAMVGHPLGVFYGYGWLRDSKGNIQYSYYDPTIDSATGKPIGVVGDDYPKKAPAGTTKTQNMPFVGAPIKDATNLHIIGNSNPAFQLSWRNEFTFLKDFTFSFLFDGVFGFDVWDGTNGALYRFGTSADTKDRDQPWFNQAGQPVMDYSDPANPKQATKLYYYRYYANGFNINEPHIEDGSFIKLREVHLEYRWHGLETWKINTVTFAVSARNLFTITKYKGYDPEVSTFTNAEGRGLDYFTLPQVRSFRFGISLTY